MDLVQIQEALDSENLTTVLEEATEQIPVDRLLIELPREDSSQELQLELLFIPGLDEELEGKKLLQFFVYMPVEISQSARDELKTAILDVNLNLPLMAFGLDTENQFVYFRHVAMFGKDLAAKDLEVVTELVWMVYYVVESSYERIELAASGRMH